MNKRLLEIIKQIDKHSKVADIGTDHCYIPAYLIKNKIADYVIATDLKEGPLKMAEKNIRGLKNIELRQGFGLNPLKTGEVDTVIIAGMGGEMIINILKCNKLEGIKKFIVQPMTDLYLVRKWIYENNFVITKESLAIDSKKIYNIIVFVYANTNNMEKVRACHKEKYYHVGIKLLENKNEIFKKYLEINIKKEEIIISNMKKSKSIDKNTIYHHENIKKIYESFLN